MGEVLELRVDAVVLAPRICVVSTHPLLLEGTRS
jgi:hypothetical protein